MGPFRQLEARGVNIETNSEQAVKSLATLSIHPAVMPTSNEPGISIHNSLTALPTATAIVSI